MIRVLIRSLRGTAVTLEGLECSDSIGDVKQRLSGLNQGAGWEAPSRLLAQGRFLSDDVTLESLLTGEDEDNSVNLTLIEYKVGTRRKAKRPKPSNQDLDPSSFLPLTVNSLKPGLDTFPSDYTDTDCMDGASCVIEKMPPAISAKPSNSRKRKTARNQRLTCPTDIVPKLKSKFKDRIAYLKTFDGRTGEYCGLDTLHPRLRQHLESVRSIQSLYSHQLRAYELRDRDFLVSTSTSSGKSLCFLLPLFKTMLENQSATALLIYPTKALAQDQLHTISDMARDIVGPSCGVIIYDGDTPLEVRESLLLTKPRILITNPDMLSCSILPYHEPKFSWFFHNLETIVLDESHVYHGIFGSHAAMVFRRLTRICTYHGSSPNTYLSTATIGNPKPHAESLLGGSNRRVELISDDGSPSSPKTFVFWNPPMAANNSHRKSPVYETAVLLAECAIHGLKSIAFCKTRKLSELVYSYTEELLAKASKQQKATSQSNSSGGGKLQIAVYRGGYMPEERRDIEKKMFDGQLMGICATNALELGIDVGQLDCTIHLGYPGSRSSLFQQAGRAGRRSSRASLCFYVAFDGPLDQYFMRNPERLFDRIEDANLDISNPKIMEQHLACAAFEHPLHVEMDESNFGIEPFSAVIEAMVEDGVLSPLQQPGKPKVLGYSGTHLHPSKNISLRNIDVNIFVVIDSATGSVLEEIEANKFPFVCYEGAVYQKLGRTYLVQSVDYPAKIASVAPASVNYFTTTIDYTEVKTPSLLHEVMLEPKSSKAAVTIRFLGFCRRRRKTGIAYDTVQLLDVPDVHFETVATQLQIPKPLIPVDPRALHAAAHALINILPRFIMCNVSDVGAECDVEHSRYRPERLLIFDRSAGGSGICEKMLPIFTDSLLPAALDLLQSCRCAEDTGCPNCTHLGSCDAYNKNLEKEGAIAFLQQMLASLNDAKMT
jgi:DEAD/DEAH box helicase domain-containing protein